MKIEDTIIKYPRTPHIQGSRLQPGDEDLRQRSFSDIKDKHVVLEEKIDGANSAVSYRLLMKESCGYKAVVISLRAATVNGTIT